MYIRVPLYWVKMEGYIGDRARQPDTQLPTCRAFFSKDSSSGETVRDMELFAANWHISVSLTVRRRNTREKMDEQGATGSGDGPDDLDETRRAA